MPTMDASIQITSVVLGRDLGVEAARTMRSLALDQLSNNELLSLLRRTSPMLDGSRPIEPTHVGCLAPPHDRVSIQRRSAQGLGLTAAAAFGVLLLAGLFLDSLRAGLT